MSIAETPTGSLERSCFDLCREPSLGMQFGNNRASTAKIAFRGHAGLSLLRFLVGVRINLRGPEGTQEDHGA